MGGREEILSCCDGLLTFPKQLRQNFRVKGALAASTSGQKLSELPHSRSMKIAVHTTTGNYIVYISSDQNVCYNSCIKLGWGNGTKNYISPTLMKNSIDFTLVIFSNKKTWKYSRLFKYNIKSSLQNEVYILKDNDDVVKMKAPGYQPEGT